MNEILRHTNINAHERSNKTHPKEQFEPIKKDNARTREC